MTMPPAPAAVSRRPAAGGFALILTLLILSVLAIVAVSFLASMGAERASAATFANRVRAEQAAKAGADSAMAMLREQFQHFPDSATTWDPAQTRNTAPGPTDPATNGGTSLYVRAVPKNVDDPVNPGSRQVPVPDAAADNRPNTSAPAGRETFVLPLISGVRNSYARLVADKADTVPALNTNVPQPEAQNFAELNPRRFRGDPQGVIGSPPVPAGSPAPTAPRPVRAPWVEFKTNLRNTGNTADEVVTSRYAFWMEDESFRANLNLITPPPVPLGTNDPFRLLRPQNASLSGLLAFLGDDNSTADAVSLFTTRSVFPAARFPEPRSLDQSTTVPSSFRDNLRYLTTLESGGLNLSRHGSRRLNLNRIIRAAPDTRVAQNRIDIRRELDQIIQTVLFHAPKFGQRFYRRPGASDADLNDDAFVTGDHPTIYLTKIAANLRDYIDKDSQPTVVKSDGSILNVSKPILAMGGESTTNEIWAIGKEPMPLFTEYMLRVKQILPLSNNARGASANYKIEIDHYLEFWNTTSRDIKVTDLGESPYISIANQPRWIGTGAPGGQDIPNNAARDILIDLTSIPNLIFKAGSATVITTDPNPPPATGPYNGAGFPDPTTLIHAPISDAKRVFEGRTTYILASYPTLMLEARPGPSNINTGMDLDTEIVLGNSLGYLDSQQDAGALQAAMLVDSYKGNRILQQSKTDTLQFHFRGAAPIGNINGPLPGPSQTASGIPYNSGDPRNHSEQLTFDPNRTRPTSIPRQSRWQPTNSYRGGSTNNDDQFIPRFNTLGYGNRFFIDPTTNAPAGAAWSDTGSLQLSPETAIANFPPPAPANDSSWRTLTSIGQLGDLYDPVRTAPSLTEIPYSSGGGRTLRIGQKDSGPASTGAIYDGKPWSKSREWAAWRLTDFFYAGDPRTGYDRDGNPSVASQTEDLLLPGLINPNGILRDDGAALRAVIDSYKFLTNGDRLDPTDPTSPKLYLTDPALSGKTLPASGRDALLAALRARLTDAARGPFFERGELSELDLFSSGTTLAGNDMAQANDRGREEFSRRLIEQTTTRGSVFSVYVLGESIAQANPIAIKRITGTSRVKVTFRVVPVFDPPLAGDEEYDPSNPADATAPKRTIRRFRQPDRYDIQVLQTSI